MTTLLPRITTLSLSSCKIKEFPEFVRIENLQYLDLSNNQIGGEIPHWNGSEGCEGETAETQQAEEIGEDEDDYVFNGFSWEAVVIGYGGGVVLGFVVGHMMFMAGKPKWYVGIIRRELGLKLRRLEIRSR
ncbi:hypothetical protein ACET3Z_012256 [Daucus carota]